jgi:hypothetical protein
MSLRTLALVVLVPFVVFTSWVAHGHGVLGFLDLASDHPWGLQVLLDLMIALSFVCGGIVMDARRRGTTAWPWVVATLTLGSIAPLAYLALRGARRR